MKLFGTDLTTDVAVIAEVGVNHEGNVDVAVDLVRAAAKAGADAVKFQSYTPERFISVSDAERFARVTRFSLNEAAHRRLAKAAEESGIVFFSSAITEDWVPLLAELSPVIKIASGDLTFEPVIRAAARTGRPIILSTGCGTLAEIDRAIGWVRGEIGDAELKDRLALLHCVSAYPTPIEQANLRAIPFLANYTGLTVGWSNHVAGPEACLAAVAIGAPLIEVHVTDRKNGRDFRDHQLSFEPDELANLVAAAARIRSSLGLPYKDIAEIELPIREPIRKGVIAARDLAAGTVLSRQDLMFSRPATTLPAEKIETVLGKRLKLSVSKLQPIDPANVAQ